MLEFYIYPLELYIYPLTSFQWNLLNCLFQSTGLQRLTLGSFSGGKDLSEEV